VVFFLSIWVRFGCFWSLEKVAVSTKLVRLRREGGGFPLARHCAERVSNGSQQPSTTGNNNNNNGVTTTDNNLRFEFFRNGMDGDWGGGRGRRRRRRRRARRQLLRLSLSLHLFLSSDRIMN